MIANILLFLAGLVLGPIAMIWLASRFAPKKKTAAAPLSPTRDELIAGVETMRDRMLAFGNATHDTALKKLAERSAAEADTLLSGKASSNEP